MAEKLLEEHQQKIESITLIPSTGGGYEVTVDGDLVYSKKATGEHAEYEQVAGPVRDRLTG
ncbi:MAG: Rdx family protein [Actinobacteria bacterium]|nr:Rdx family protein [Actinomycetota bacterium]